MKTILTLISIIGLQYAALSQATAKVPTRNQNAETPSKAVRFEVTNPDRDFMVAKFTPSSTIRNVVITNIPSSTDALTSVNIELEMKGAFSFKKDASLQIPFNQEVFIEDKLTGKMFNLKSSQAYTFNVDQHMPNRFVMHVLDKSEDGTSLTSR